MFYIVLFVLLSISSMLWQQSARDYSVYRYTYFNKCPRDSMCLREHNLLLKNNENI